MIKEIIKKITTKIKEHHQESVTKRQQTTEKNEELEIKFMYHILKCAIAT